ncbi:nuclear transport factor 2 family protein [Pseudoduganella ginsengisoli]|uniref:Nuclear transport factor 2 family protein n=1 Tax=Pseudoduganella ginsengisoli TaxID=1462440 RepID=A0A6L6PW00_9BURK|nr:nuclear transport factor 2 family protein [Pseudoduganella ginsengisoli]MTW01615.1 nuclear transport factor 2 family protein [Pseudoduganella ginsengisoli]
MTDFTERIARLEAVEAIRQLKARYFHSCDSKNPAGMRACFVAGPVDIDYGALGRFTDRDALVQLFTQLGCHPHIVEMHHGANPDITIIDSDNARGTWSLHYQQIDTVKQTVTQFGACYDDAYRREDGVWKISATRCQVTSCAVLSIADGVPRVLHAGAG